MVDPSLLCRFLVLRLQPCTVTCGAFRCSITAFQRYYTTNKDGSNNRGKWFTLPPFSSTINGSNLGKQLVGGPKVSTSEMMALKWVHQCCPQLPRSLIQKLFRLRQVRREFITIKSSENGGQLQESKLKRVAAKDSLKLGDRIFLPITIQEFPTEKQDCPCTDEELNYIRSLELYKDSAIIVVNKPPGMPVQGGIGIKRSLDELAATCLTYDYSELPRLVHRLDRDSSGILVMGRTHTSATVLHSVFREKTIGASKDDINNEKRILRRWYWALVIGSPRRSKGLISAPLGKVVLDNGKSDRITVVNNSQNMTSQHAITEYRVIDSSHGYTWLELSPLTGRKHQLRVHCAEVLGTPIVGDYKYGWQAHRKWKELHSSDLIKNSNEKVSKEKALPFGLDLENGSIFGKHPHLHLHCKEMILPNVSQAVQAMQSSSDYDLSELKTLKLVAPLPSHMQRSWDFMNS
ncbi:RNA pseudouridine synthase 4, mitochondrial-like isoform X1 [Mangifera indica]|uniref:RNA pseudouridine synthase 4, mitochondrial-like isoform X1 n=1 Tax=Mangifera indica TaxID=29780 RepID=UPI001CFA36F9|nr:RNA pseudouridine synthase 4, mitochondrial-like isoform X1 [Mangifera indica]